MRAAVTIPAAGPVEGAAVIICPPGADRMPDSCVLQLKFLGMQSVVGILQGFSNLFLPYDQPLHAPSGGRGGAAVKASVCHASSATFINI